ncbi:DNA polymerase Y family protein [Okibacterium endophyticum]
MKNPTRTMLIWCPDWPVAAASQAAALPPDTPLALIDHGEVFACTATARHEGVRQGLRVREAQSRCPSLVVQHYDPGLDHRAFEPVITLIESLVPGVQLLRPGSCLVRARGPARYYGGESAAAQVVIDALGGEGVTDVRIGIADGPFAAEHAARRGNTPADAIGIVPAGESPAFLAPMPVGTLGRPELTTLLRRLGIHTLGDFAALDAAQVRDRFGPDGARAHRLASGLDPSDVVPRTPPVDLDAVAEFEPPLDRVDQIAFAFRTAAERFTEALAAAGLVATAITVAIVSERGPGVQRTWQHPRWFTANDVLDRVRWQLQGASSADSGLTGAITRVVVSPEAVDAAGNHETGLWGGGADERIHHGLTRVQSMVGHNGVLTAMMSGGRMLADRTVRVPWGDVPSGGADSLRRSAGKPWPGHLPGPPPSTVFDTPRPVTVQGADGTDVDVDERGTLHGRPERFAFGEVPTPELSAVAAWAGPWAVTERWWDASGRRLHRFQLIDARGFAWLLVLEDHRWFAEGFYD